MPNPLPLRDRFRRLAATLALALATQLFPAASVPARADASCASLLGGNTVPLSPGVFMTGVPTPAWVASTAPHTYGRQRSPNWCWAAAIQMVLNYHGVVSAQEGEVASLLGQVRDAPASSWDMVRILNGWRFHASGRVARVDARLRRFVTPADFVAELRANRPVLVALTTGGPIGHEYVLTSMTWSWNPWYRSVQPLSVALRDPWPDNPSRIEMPWWEFQSRFVDAVLVDVAL